MLSSDAIFAKKRLWRDLKELSREAAQLHTVSALPTANIFEWHSNLRPDEGPFAGTIFHIVLKFPHTYPKEPPAVFLCTSIDHPNVFGGADYFSHEHPYVCLDMLQIYYTHQPYVGWSSAYSVTSVLLQLQSFLFAEKVPQDYGGYQAANGNMERNAQAIRHAREFSCEIFDQNGETVEHTHQNPWPPLPKYKGEKGLSKAFIYKLPVKRVYKLPVKRDAQNKDSKLVISPWQKQATTNHEANFVFQKEDFPALHSFVGMTTAVQPPVGVSPPVLATEIPGKEVQEDFTQIIPTAVYIHMFGFLSPSDIFKARDVCSAWRRVIISYNMFERTQVACFHTKATLDDESTVLGVGLTVNFFEGRPVLSRMPLRPWIFCLWKLLRNKVFGRVYGERNNLITLCLLFLTKDMPLG
jgi:ubiquitin-protein ligase